jgi:hypothetical protein
LEAFLSSEVLVYTPEITPRVEFTFRFIFQEILGASIVFTEDLGNFGQSGSPKINYSPTNTGGGLFLKAHSILFEKHIKDQLVDLVDFQEIKLFFPTSADSFLPFDPFAVTFYLLTRYEEYLNEATDQHNRFLDSENLLVKLNLHQTPIVDRIAYWIADALSATNPVFRVKKRNFRMLTTIDIDNAWAFRNKNLMISAGGMAKTALTGKWDELVQRTSVLLRLQSDPYDTYEYILEVCKQRLDHLLFFFLVGDRNQFDKNISHKNKSFRQLITEIASYCEVGIHPSYSSNEKPWMFDSEKERLENIIGRPVAKSRQHFLKLKFPQTYQTAIKAGITDDYTMGFASLAGFRAGTCTPFPFFDLGKNAQTNLTIHPFQIMDVTLKDYLNLQPEEAWLLTSKLMDEVKKVNGTFAYLFHNESLHDLDQWQGWRGVFEQILEKGITLENE